MIDWVLDASAILALIRAEPGADRVLAALPNAVWSSVNAAEVVTKLIRSGTGADDARKAVQLAGCPIVPVDEALALRAGTLAASSKGLSLGDRICLALAEREKATALTSDRAWASLGLSMKVSLIR